MAKKKSAKKWTTSGFEAFRRGTFGNGGHNLYVSKAGILQRIYQYDLNHNGYFDLVFANCPTPEFSYGEGNGLKVITRAVSTKNEMATRIYAYGSDRNLPTRYYNNLTPYIKDHESVYIPHLMLPLTDWGTTGGLKDARLAYLENSTAVNKYGLIPKIMRFDGTGDLEDIYPSVEGMTVGDVADQDFPATGWSSSQRIDEVVGVENPTDNGMYTEDSVKLKDDTVTLSITDPNKTYTVLAGQEAVTIANDSTLFQTSSAMNAGGTSGRFVIKMGGLSGTVSAASDVLGDYLTDVPRAFVEVYVGSDLQTSQEMKVTTTKMQDDFGFKSDDITFTTTSTGICALCRIRKKGIRLSLSPPIFVRRRLVVKKMLLTPAILNNN